MSPTSQSQSPAFYPSSLYMPSIGLLDPSSPTVIMSVSGAGLDATKKSVADEQQSQTSVGHMMSGIDCGRIADPLDPSHQTGLTLMDLTSMTSFIKSDPMCDPTSSSSPFDSQHHHMMTSLSGPTATTVLPPVSTFLLPNFRDQNWWADRHIDRLKMNTKDPNDCECYAPDEREYNGSTSPSHATTLPASLSN
jgi:hypothetical protein